MNKPPSAEVEEPLLRLSARFDEALVMASSLHRAQARKASGVTADDMAAAWFSFLADGQEPPSRRIARRLIAAGAAGILAPSYAPGAAPADHNLVLWDWSDRPPHKIAVFDPSGRLPKDQLSWR